MRKGLIGYSLLSYLLIALLACTEEVTPTPYTYTKVFTGTKSKTWKIQFFEQTLNGKVVDTFNVACTSDDGYTFYADAEHTYNVTTGATLCDTSEAAVYNDFWTFTNASATITMIVPVFSTDGPLPFIVRSVSESAMVTEIFLDAANTQSYRLHFQVKSQN